MFVRRLEYIRFSKIRIERFKKVAQQVWAPQTKLFLDVPDVRTLMYGHDSLVNFKHKLYYLDFCCRSSQLR
jgi:hypothetical protein